MKFFKKLSVTVLLALTLIAPTFSFTTETREVSAAGTGYTKASDVKYVTSGSYIANWGARDEECVFLSEYAEDFYTGEYAYTVLSQKSGGTGQSNARGTALYSALQTKMKSAQEARNFYTYYEGNKNVRQFYKYADCVKSDTSKVSLLYKGDVVSSAWNGGSTWNQEHMWPKSKLGSDKEIGDIMQLRPADPSENSRRGNTAYGESSGYYDPDKCGQSVRGDCARMALFMYVRWGSNSMWGTGGVIENLRVLLDWMEEDPVDTWEMGRNDAVQSITGTRNIFVDYPEYAWLLFGQSVPRNMVTPSGIAKTGVVPPPTSSEEDSSVGGGAGNSSSNNSGTSDSSSVGGSGNTSESVKCEHELSQWITVKAATETEAGERRRVCVLCQVYYEKEVIPALNGSGQPSDSQESENGCEHEFSQWIIMKAATETETGERRRVCKLCNHLEKEVIPMLSTEEEVLPPAKTGCAATVSGAMGGALLMLASCVFVDRKRKRNQ